MVPVSPKPAASSMYFVLHWAEPEMTAQAAFSCVALVGAGE